MTDARASHSDLVRGFMACMTKRDIDAALQYLSPDVTIWEPEGLPYGGTFNGHSGFLEFADRFAATWRSWRDGEYTYADVGDVTFKENSFSARPRRSEATVTMHLVEVFYFRGSKILGVRPHYWDVAAIIAATT